jgi:hypothetical protein
MPWRHNEDFEQVGAQGDVPRMCPFHIFFPNVQRWMAHWIVGQEIPEKLIFQYIVPINKFPKIIF